MRMPNESETIIYSNGPITVTATRFISSGTTYAIRNITSIRTSQKTPSKLGYWLLIVAGLAQVAAMNIPIIGVPMIGLGVWLLFRRKTTYFLMINTSAKEVSAFESHDESQFKQVYEALSQAMVENGK